MPIQASCELANEVGVSGGVSMLARVSISSGQFSSDSRVAVFVKDLMRFAGFHAHWEWSCVEERSGIAARKALNCFLVQLEGFRISFDKATLCSLQCGSNAPT